jgi:hypothetical protein
MSLAHSNTRLLWRYLRRVAITKRRQRLPQKTSIETLVILN